MTGADCADELRHEPEAVLVKDDLISAIGAMRDIIRMTGDSAEKTDLEGKCLMPSFIDGHSHILMNGQMSLFADLSGCQSFEDIIDALHNYQEQSRLTTDDVLIGFGYDHNFLKEEMHPDKRVLDRVNSNIPIFILHVSGHLACANSAALELAHITAKTPDPEGGMIGRLPDGGEPSGYVEEAECFLSKWLSCRV